uniref:Uncharacterized protein n=1 Tax=Cacopsylla melanoneura TaxID=428564 RepID=A0A8D8LBF9_9HEMI
MIDQKIKTQCVMFDNAMINQSHVNQLVDLNLKKQMKISKKFMYLLERYLKNREDALKNVKKDNKTNEAKDKTEKPQNDETEKQEESRKHLDAKREQKMININKIEQPVDKGSSKNMKHMVLFKHEEKKYTPTNTF